MDSYIVKRDDSLTVIAGYPWFLDWGRDTLIALRGIIAAGRLDAARDILTVFARYEWRGTLPNMIRGDDASNRDTSDAPLWFFTACNDLVRAEDDDGFLTTDCGGRTVREILVSIATNYQNWTPNGIHMDSESGLIYSPSHFTWMDTNHPAGTPREGYPIEIQSLWYAALAFLASHDDSSDWAELAARVRSSIAELFTRTDLPGLSDCLHAAAGTPARQAKQDDAVRPNQLFAVTLGACESESLRCGILQACEELLIPGAIRSLANRELQYALPVSHNGQALNDPHRPYYGRYRGDEDTSRKPAYHNGTAWTWVFPSYCEAMLITHGDAARDSALALLNSSALVVNQGCARHVPEILDGDYPHAERGCGAQAWGVTELYRVLTLLDPPPQLQPR